MPKEPGISISVVDRDEIPEKAHGGRHSSSARVKILYCMACRKGTKHSPMGGWRCLECHRLFRK